MICKKCGYVLNDNDQFCQNCGTPVNDVQAQTNVNNGVMPSATPVTPSYSEPSTTPVTPSYSASSTTPVTPSYSASSTTPVTPSYSAPSTTPVTPSYSAPSTTPVTPSYSASSTTPVTPSYSEPEQARFIGNNNGPVMSNKQSQANYSNYNNTNNGTKKSSLVLIIVGLLVVSVVVGVVMFFVGKGGQTPVTPVETVSSYKIVYKGFSLSIPDNYVYEEKDNCIMISDEEGTWAAQLELQQGSFSQLVSNKNQLQAVFQKNGYTASEVKEQKIGGVDFLTVELGADGQQAVLGMTKVNAMYFMGLTVFNQNNEFDYSALEKLIPIVTSAKADSSANNMESKPSFSLDDVATLAQ